MHTDIPFTEIEKHHLYNVVNKLSLSFPIVTIGKVKLYWRKGMFKRGRLARCYALKKKICIGEKMRGFDHNLDSDEVKNLVPQFVHEARHMQIAADHPIIYQLTKALPFIQHNFMGVLQCEREANEQLGRAGASQLKP